MYYQELKTPLTKVTIRNPMSLIKTEQSDTELTKAIKASDDTAFEVLYFRYSKAIFSFTWRQTKNYELANELTQETFVKVWNNRKNLKTDKSIKNYLYNIARNLAIDHLRKSEREADYLSQIPSVQSLSYQDDDFELREQIIASVDKLPEPLRVVFSLSRFEGFKNQEISETLHISIKTVESRLSRALKILQEKLHPLLAMIPFLHFFS